MLKHNSGTVFEIENQLPELPALRLIYVSTIYDAAYYWTGGKRREEQAVERSGVAGCGGDEAMR